MYEAFKEIYENGQQQPTYIYKYNQIMTAVQFAFCVR